MTGIPALSRRAFAPLLAALAVAVVSLAPSAAHAITDDTVITALKVKITTGGDDLRTASNAVASLKYSSTSGVPLVASANLNNGASWGNGSTNTVNIPLPANVLYGRLIEFSIQFTSGQPDIFATGDNWNMNSITVYGVLVDGTEIVLINQAGSPLWRFQSDTNTRWTTAL